MRKKNTQGGRNTSVARDSSDTCCKQRGAHVLRASRDACISSPQLFVNDKITDYSLLQHLFRSTHCSHFTPGQRGRYTYPQSAKDGSSNLLDYTQISLWHGVNENRAFKSLVVFEAGEVNFLSLESRHQLLNNQCHLFETLVFSCSPKSKIWNAECMAWNFESVIVVRDYQKWDELLCSVSCL